MPREILLVLLMAVIIKAAPCKFLLDFAPIIKYFNKDLRLPEMAA